ncbi:3-deoxy-D-manno-octulosonic acid transferase [Thalassobium sp. R2A62]|jgi:3-deoxy-D-manno-octulosonic-acid transferase|uniref:3-deoxy-D-manno-octulosonic acid transferase n=1 Tax=Thalassobium sp. R2A62 TaxID=633131 RepID=UPI0001B1D428|nr:glycosyltransferase N-terminal domain-containing protein [Thalassobium sp. R2A62]EET49021.1 3-deoxy-D-manno-octulosonic-acid [Thalassobium sp. R2A62]MDG1338520.1 glycosyltransferase N-terminal domain-containing protein [Paracoccaceae bacterium]
MTRSLSLAAYKALRRGGKEDATTEYNARPRGRVIWGHAPTAVDVEVFCHVADRLRDHGADVSLVVTTDAEPMPDPRAVAVLPTPSETVASARHFLSHWAPDMVLWARGGLHPVLLSETDGLDAPRYLIAAQADALENKESRWFPDLGKSLVRRFDRIIAQDAKSVVALKKMGARPWLIDRGGPITPEAAPLQHNEAERADLALVLSGRPVWLAAGVDLSEVDALCHAHRRANTFAHRLLLIVSPAHAEDGIELAVEMGKCGFNASVRSEGADPTEDTQIYVADLPDELGLWYRVAPITYLGGTLGAASRRSPLESAALGSAVVHGPQVKPFEKDFQRLMAANAALSVADTEELAAGIERLLSPDKAAVLAHNAWQVTTAGAEATDQVVDLLKRGLR